MNRYGHGWVHLWAGTQVVVETGRSLWQSMKVFVEEKHEGKQVNLFSGGYMYIAAPVDELKGHCAGYAEKEEIN